MPFHGGLNILGTSWVGSAVAVDFDAGDYTDKLFQLYVNRKLVDHTRLPTDRRLIGPVTSPQISAAVLNVLAVEPSEALIDFGDIFERSPWNRYTLTWTIAEGYSADCDHFDILAATAPDTAPSVVVLRVPYLGPRTYRADLPVISETGDWQYAVVPRDNAKPVGNAGDQIDVTIPALIYPRDVVLRSDGSRFGTSITGGVLTVSFELAT